MAGSSPRLLACVGEQGSGVGPVGAGPPPLLALDGWPSLDTLCVSPAEGLGLVIPCVLLAVRVSSGGVAQWGRGPGHSPPAGWGPGAPFPGAICLSSPKTPRRDGAPVLFPPVPCLGGPQAQVRSIL